MEFTVASFARNERVELHPATDAWMQGDRFGEVVKVGREYVHVRMDRSARKLAIRPRHIGAIL